MRSREPTPRGQHVIPHGDGAEPRGVSLAACQVPVETAGGDRTALEPLADLRGCRVHHDHDEPRRQDFLQASHELRPHLVLRAGLVPRGPQAL